MELTTGGKQSIRVAITDLDVPFGRMVGFLVKCAFAAMPAFIIVFGTIAVVNAAIAGIVGAAFS